MNTLRALALLAALHCAGAHAEEAETKVWVNAGFLSYHFDRAKDYREDNWGFGVEAALTPRHGVMAGTYLNSDYHRSRYVGYQWRPLEWRHGDAQVYAGVGASLVDGYPTMKDKGWFLAPLPFVALEGRRFGANFLLIPNKHGGAFAVQLKLRAF